MSTLTRFLLICTFISMGPLIFADQASDSSDIGTLAPNGVLHVTAQEAHTYLTNNPDTVVLDVRTGWEFSGDRISGAININYYSPWFRGSIKELDPLKTYLIHCKSGVRSRRAVRIMIEEGFGDLVHMDGGINAWLKADLPITNDE